MPISAEKDVRNGFRTVSRIAGVRARKGFGIGAQRLDFLETLGLVPLPVAIYVQVAMAHLRG